MAKYFWVMGLGAGEFAMASEYYEGRNGYAWNGVWQRCVEEDFCWENTGVWQEMGDTLFQNEWERTTIFAALADLV